MGFGSLFYGFGNRDLVGTGTVTSVALSMPSVFSVSGSPITSSGTLAVTLATQSANLVFAGPTTGAAAAPTFRSLVSADIPALGDTYYQNAGNAFAGNATIGLTDNFGLSILTNNASRINILAAGEVGIGTAGVTNQRQTNKGAGATSSTYSFVSGDSGSNVYFYVRDDGAVSSKSGYWIDGNKTLYYGGGITSNIFCGFGSGNNTTTGTGLAGFGMDSLQAVTTAVSCTAVGRAALKTCTIGDANTAIGHQAGTLILDGASNTILGAQGAVNLAAGSSNISIGAFSLASLVNGNRVIGIGRSIEVTSDISDSFGAGSNGFITASNQVVFGSAVSNYNDWYVGRGVFGTTLGTTSFNVTGITVGTADTSAASGIFSFNGARGTGTGVGGDLRFQVAVAGSTGSTQNALAEAWRISGTNGYLSNTGAAATSYITLKAGTTAASTAPLKFTTGPVNTTAEVGAFEYTTPQLFFTNDGAQRQEIPLIQQSRVSTQFDATTTTLGNITGLTATLVAGKIYRFEAILHITADVTGGSKIAIAGTATATAIIYEIILVDNTSNLNTITARHTALAGSSAQAGTTSGFCRVTGLITCANAGTLTVQFAQSAANATSSVLVGSTFQIQESI